jgi:hypothetical protein
MLSRLMMRFGVEEQKAKLELATSKNNTSVERAYIDQEGTTLVINEAFDRSWRRVGLALDRIGFTVEDRNREEGIYFVRYVNPDIDSKKKGDDKGILSNIMFWRSDDKDTAKAAKFRIQVHNTGANACKVTFLNDDGSAVNSATSSRILNVQYAHSGRKRVIKTMSRYFVVLPAHCYNWKTLYFLVRSVREWSSVHQYQAELSQEVHLGRVPCRLTYNRYSWFQET